MVNLHLAVLLPLVIDILSIADGHPHELNIGALLDLNTANATLIKIRHAAVDLAVQNMRKQWDFPIHYFTGDAGCNGQKSIGESARLIYTNNVSAIIGPSCNEGCVTGGHLATYHNMIMISHNCSSAQMSNKVKYPTFGRTRAYATASPRSTTSALLAFFADMKWQRIGIIHGNDEDLSATAMTVKESLENASISVSFHKDYIRGHFTSSADACIKAVKGSSVRSKCHLWNYSFMHIVVPSHSLNATFFISFNNLLQFLQIVFHLLLHSPLP